MANEKARASRSVNAKARQVIFASEHSFLHAKVLNGNSVPPA
ncbi:hypothetical protein LEP1GSC061_3908 [Leptospira wolffii serovar Khorat str. Khorat-H2]|nr:hypothetical protein LEP1GSC061_3908 [Leptospira wolffii serovar Khorat str. Khorat-H2]